MEKNISVYLFFAMAFVVVLIVSNISAANVFYINDYITFSAAEFLFPISYVINDLIVELFGFKRTTKVIIIGLFLSLFATVFLYITTLIPSGYVEYQTVFGYLTSGVVGITIASFFAYFAGSMLNAIIMSKMKKKHKEKKFFARAMLSTLVAEFTDSLIFITFCCIFASAFYHFENLISLVLTITTIKMLVELLVFPLTNFLKNKLTKLDYANPKAE